LRVLGTVELPHIDQGVRQQLHAKMALLQVFETQEEPLELILPGESPIDTSPQGMDRGIEAPLAPALGALAMAGIHWDVRDHACDAQLFRPTASLCGSTPWSDQEPTFAQGLGTSRVKADLIPLTQGRTSRTPVEPVDRGDSSGETSGRTPLVHINHLHDNWRPHGQSRCGSAPPGQPGGVTR
jgi:hypothetical protein